MNSLELKFRQELIEKIPLIWTIHVENHLNPGVPDLSFVHPYYGYETGWLEIKADEGKNQRIKFQPGQYIWMTKHASYIPAYILFANNEQVMLFSGEDIGRVDKSLDEWAIMKWPRDGYVPGLFKKLIEFTDRSLNAVCSRGV